MVYSGNVRLTRTTIVFAAGIIILAGLVFGGIWLAKERGEQARQKEAIAIAEQNLNEQSGVVTNPDTTDENLPPTEAEVRVQEEAARAAAAAQTGSQNTADLPTTGPELSQIFIITILALSISYYIASRRQVSHR